MEVMQKKLGTTSPYCYLLQFANVISVAINRNKCFCNVEQTCKSANGSCKKYKKNLHVATCSRPLCKNCQLFKDYYFLCYKMIFTEEAIAFQIYVKKLISLCLSKNNEIKHRNLQKTDHCYHSNDYQDHKKCVIFEPQSFHIYSSRIKREITFDEQKQIHEMSLIVLPKDVSVDNVDNIIAASNRRLESALYFRISDMEIEEDVLYLNIDKLIDLNNIVTGGRIVMVRQRQMYTYVEKEKIFKNSMDVRCIRYHLEALVYVFNKRKIEVDEFKRNILRIRPFKSGNYRTMEILLLGIKNNKRN